MVIFKSFIQFLFLLVVKASNKYYFAEKNNETSNFNRWDIF